MKRYLSVVLVLVVFVLTLQVGVFAESTQLDLNKQTVQSEKIQKKHGNAFMNGVANIGKYSWKGIKWTCYGIKVSAIATKNGCVSFSEYIGLKRKPGELTAHEDILDVANKTLVESKTKRTMRDYKGTSQSNNVRRSGTREVRREKVVIRR